jgi:hypothetical protein
MRLIAIPCRPIPDVTPAQAGAHPEMAHLAARWIDQASPGPSRDTLRLWPYLGMDPGLRRDDIVDRGEWGTATAKGAPA